jgi:hypothetical protein
MTCVHPWSSNASAHAWHVSVGRELEVGIRVDASKHTLCCAKLTGRYGDGDVDQAAEEAVLCAPRENRHVRFESRLS